MAEFVAGQRVAGIQSHYTVAETLGEGGFGVAFVAVDGGGRRVVLKQLQVARMGDWKAMELFEREARVLASLDHPNIPRCHEFCATDGDRAVPAVSRTSCIVIVEPPNSAPPRTTFRYSERTIADQSTPACS